MASAQYVVEKGDTLGGIAKKLGVSTSNLTGYRSGNTNLIYPGETLSIKKPDTPPRS
jgi:LysM repeat protein